MILLFAVMMVFEVISMLLSELVAAWINARALNLAPSTISGYRRLLRLYIAETAVGAAEIGSLDGSDMIELLRPLIARGCTRQAQLLQILVSAALKSAVKRRELQWNPMDEVDRIKHRSKITPWLTIDQARKLLTCSAEADDPYYIAWVLMLSCGLRRGEMLALEWGDVDFSRALLHVQRQHVDVDGVHYITKPKSFSSVRDIPLDDHVLSILRLQARPAGCIITATKTTLADALDRALQRANLPRITLHGLRHTMASVAVEDGIPVKVLQGLMGHSHYQTTADIYAHINQRPRVEAARLISHSLLGARLEIV